MLTLTSILKSWGKRLRNSAFRGPMSDLAELRQEVAQLRERVRRGSLAFSALESTGAVVDVTPEERSRDVTRSGICATGGALGFDGWESSIAAYRSAFQLAIDYLAAIRCPGPILEFGTCSGFTARQISELMNARGFDRHLYLYDSFEGLPDMTGTPDEFSYEVAENKVWHRGAMATPPGYEKLIWDSLVSIRPAEKLHMVKGFYDQTLDDGLPKEKCSLVHIDCDIYISAKYVLNKLAEKELFQDGCLVMFDDWNSNRANPNMGERRALREFLEEHPKWTCSQWFHYGWAGMTFIFHENQAA